MTMQEKIKTMQSKILPREDVFQNINGTWSHRHDASRQFSDKLGAQTDFRFAQDWLRGRAS